MLMKYLIQPKNKNIVDAGRWFMGIFKFGPGDISLKKLLENSMRKNKFSVVTGVAGTIG